MLIGRPTTVGWFALWNPRPQKDRSATRQAPELRLASRQPWL